MLLEQREDGTDLVPVEWREQEKHLALCSTLTYIPNADSSYSKRSYLGRSSVQHGETVYYRSGVKR